MSMYNDIRKARHDRIVVDCSPDQFERNVVSLDREDYEQIKILAHELGWDESDQPTQ